MPTIEITDAMYARILDAFSEAIRQLRYEHDEDQPTFGQRYGVKQSSVSRWETGFCLPRVRKLTLIAAREGVSVDWLLGFSDVRSGTIRSARLIHAAS